MKRKNILVALAALCLSLALCASPALLFAATDAALFSTTYTQNARRGSLSVTGDDVYLARVLHEPGNYLYIETGYDVTFYYDTVIALLDDFQEAGLVDDTYRSVLDGIVSLCADDMGGLRCMILTVDFTQYSGSTGNTGFFITVENTTGKATDVAFWMNGGVFGWYPGGSSTQEARALMEAYIQYLGFDVFGDWEFYVSNYADAALEAGYLELWACSPSGDVYIWMNASASSISLAATAGEMPTGGMTLLE